MTHHGVKRKARGGTLLQLLNSHEVHPQVIKPAVVHQEVVSNGGELSNLQKLRKSLAKIDVRSNTKYVKF
jgi:hypothetical protein